jgi:hypothetical protein
LGLACVIVGHTFADARDALYEQARVALEWIVGPRP